MAAHGRANRGRTGALALAVLVLCCARGTPADAEATPAAPEPAVELWVGLKRINPPAPAVKPAPAPAANTTIEIRSFRPMRPSTWIEPTPPKMLPPAPMAMPEMSPPVAPKMAPAVEPPAPLAPRPVEDPLPVEHVAEAVVRPLPAPQPHVEDRGSRPEPKQTPASPEARGVFASVLAQTTALLGAMALFVLVVLLAHGILARRYGGSLKNLFRFELINNPAKDPRPKPLAPQFVVQPIDCSGPIQDQLAAPVIDAAPGTIEEPTPESAPVATVPEAEPEAEHLDPEPADEALDELHEAEGSPHEEALLRHIYDQNLQLRAEIDRQQAQSKGQAHRDTEIDFDDEEA